MFKKFIKKENGKIYEVIWEDAYGRHLTINYIADYEEEPQPKKANKKITLDE